MKSKTRRVVGGLIIAAGSVGALSAILIRKRGNRHNRAASDVWARPGMLVTFRAELMPGHSKSKRTFKVKELLPSGRVLLHDVSGEHAEKEFEQIER